MMSRQPLYVCVVTLLFVSSTLLSCHAFTDPLERVKRDVINDPEGLILEENPSQLEVQDDDAAAQVAVGGNVAINLTR